MRSSMPLRNSTVAISASVPPSATAVTRMVMRLTATRAPKSMTTRPFSASTDPVAGRPLERRA